MRLIPGQPLCKAIAARPILLAALAIGALFLLVACGGNPTPTQPGGALAPTETVERQVTQTRPAPAATLTPGSTLGVVPEEIRGIALQFWHVWPGEQGERLLELIARFNQTNEFGITVEAIYAGNFNDLNDRIHATSFDVDLPDLVVGYPYHITSWAGGSHSLVDLNAYVLDPIWGYPQPELADFYPAFLQEDLSAGARLGLPVQRSGQLLYYNLTWAKQLGFDTPPRTPVEFKQQACAASQASRSGGDPSTDGTGGWAIDTSPSAVLSWMYAFGVPAVHPAGRGYLFDTPEAEQALVFLKDLYDSGCAWLVEGDSAESEFASRLALFVAASLADLPYQSVAFELAANEDEWTVIPFPSVEQQPVITTYGPSVAVFSSSPPEQLAAWVFVKWLVSPAIQAEWVETSGLFPVRASALGYLDNYTAAHPEWSAASQLLPYARTEPGFPSWRTVRWAVSDVGTQTFRSYFTADRIPATLKLLDETAAELHIQIR